MPSLNNPLNLVQLSIDAASGVARLTFNRPDVLNAIDVPTARALRDQALVLAQDERIRCVVLAGHGRAFVAGGDLSRFAQDFDRAEVVVDELLDALHPAIETLHALDAPVLAAVQGAVAGAGLSLMAACDLVIAAEGTRFMMAYDRVGAPPDCGATYELPRLIGPRRAAQFYLLGETLDAEQAMAMGLVNRVVPADQLDAQAQLWAVKVASGPTRAYGSYKRLVQQSHTATLSEQLEAERIAFKAATRTDDFRLGVRAFLAKQLPRFSGR